MCCCKALCNSGFNKCYINKLYYYYYYYYYYVQFVLELC